MMRKRLQSVILAVVVGVSQEAAFSASLEEKSRIELAWQSLQDTQQATPAPPQTKDGPRTVLNGIVLNLVRDVLNKQVGELTGIEKVFGQDVEFLFNKVGVDVTSAKFWHNENTGAMATREITLGFEIKIDNVAYPILFHLSADPKSISYDTPNHLNAGELLFQVVNDVSYNLPLDTLPRSVKMWLEDRLEAAFNEGLINTLQARFDEVGIYPWQDRLIFDEDGKIVTDKTKIAEYLRELSERGPGDCFQGQGCAVTDGKWIIQADPTFVQPSRSERPPQKSRASTDHYNGLFANISLPQNNALVRGNVPVFGVAYGDNFAGYRIKYGLGADPSSWVLVNESTAPQTNNAEPLDFQDSADLGIEGNLATWDTGLKNYVYLPSHPRDHPIDLKGTYTVRLTVTGKDSSTVEDRVTVAVADVIPNAFGGTVVSPDKKVTLTVPEQAIMSSFRLILIQQADQDGFVPPPGRQLVGKFYEAREGGEEFTKESVLEIKLSEQELGKSTLDRLGIYGYDPKTKKWQYVATYRRESERSLFAKIRKLHGYYAVMSSTLLGEGSTVQPLVLADAKTQQLSVPSGNSSALVQNTFENGLGDWSNRDGDVGATVSLDKQARADGTQALRISNTNDGGNFAVNVLRRSFDAKDYPLVQLDYRIPSDVKTNFLVKAAGRWYEIGFTDDHKELRNKRVNIAHIGTILGIVADDKWHTAKFNLYNMLRTKTGNTVVEEMIMADWDVGGYMKLQFGKNRAGATYYIDNFTISRELTPGLRANGANLLVDTFDQNKERNALGGMTSVFADGNGGRIDTSLNHSDAVGRGNALALSYDVSKPGSHAGYMTSLRNLDLRGFHTLRFMIKGSEAGQDLWVGLKDQVGSERKVPLRFYLPKKIATGWETVSIPLASFSDKLDWGKLSGLTFSFEHAMHPSGTVSIDSIEFHKEIRSFTVDDFENENGVNLVAGKHWTFASGAAAVNGNHAKDSGNTIYRLSYGGNIGEIKAYASDIFSYAGWSTELGGIDCSRGETVSFRVRGAQGGEKPNIYLDDGNFRWGVDIEKYAPIMTHWQNVTIPLSDFAEYGVDLTHLAEFQVVFEWEKMSGTIYLDDIRFGSESEKRKEQLQQVSMTH